MLKYVLKTALALLMIAGVLVYFGIETDIEATFVKLLEYLVKLCFRLLSEWEKLFQQLTAG